MENNNQFASKFADLIKEKNFYRLLLIVKTDLRKLAKKSELKNFFDLLNWCSNILKENEESESCITLSFYAIEEYEKYYNRADMELCLESFMKNFNTLPKKFDKSKLKHKFLTFFESKHISDIALQLHGYYEAFARDSLDNNDMLEGYRYALKSQDYSTLKKLLDSFSGKSASEMKYLITRICMELILIRNVSLGLKFIHPHIDFSNNLQNNHPIINFGYLLTSLLSKNPKFDDFWTFINIYKPIIEVDQSFIKYLNKISLVYFNRAIIQENNMNGLMNILKAFSG